MQGPTRPLRPRPHIAWVVAVAALAAGAAPGRAADEIPKSAPLLDVRAGDHVAIVGNTLADRMQHDGWLEAYLVGRFPKYDLTIRNLGFAADELTIRLRSANFGTPDEWLKRCEADVVLAFFGANEAWAGPDGLPKFKKDLDDFIKHTLGQKPNGRTAPRLVIFSPTAHEDLHDRNLPDGKDDDTRRALYTDAMAEVAGANRVPFVDLYRRTLDLYAKADKPLTLNGIHFTAEGNRRLAASIDHALFAGTPEPKREAKELERLRQAILDKNFYWFNRYRTVDGYSIYGGRADLKFTDGQTNREVMQREMEVLDVMTANRDKRVWAVAKGGDLEVDDANTPPFIPVKTNKPGDGPNGEHTFLGGGAEAIGKMTVAKGMKVNLFASEEDFPEVANPVQMAFDPKGRLWVAVWPTYPHWKPKEAMDDKLLILEDSDGDGKADKRTVFADGLHCPTGFEFGNGGVFIAQAPDLMFLKDTDGDDKADVRERVLHGLDSADTHHTSNSFTVDPGGALYFQEGTFHRTQVETPHGPPVRLADAGVFRYEPRTQKFEVYVTFGFANPHGHTFDRWGQDVVVDGTGANPYHGTLFSGHLDFPQKHGRPPQVYQQRTRPCPGVETLSSKHFPQEMQGNLLVGNVIGFQGILQYKVEDRGASFTATEVEPLVSSSDPNFRPTDIEVGPDGAIYFMDWQNPIIGHMQHNLRDPSRDRTHGRVYRITYEGRPLSKAPKIAGEPIAKLLDLLKEPEDRVRSRAKLELTSRNSDEVAAATRQWLAGLDRADADYEHRRLEGLWVLQGHNVVDRDLLKAVLQSPESRARAAGVRVLCSWRDRVPEALELLKGLAADPYPRVRLEAVRAASFFTVPEAIEVPLIAMQHPTDEYLDYTRTETMRALEPYWKRAVAEGRQITFSTDAADRFLLKSLGTEDLLKLKGGKSVYRERLLRKGLRDADRRAALVGLAKLESKPELPVLLDAIRAFDDQKGDQEESVAFDLARLLTGRPAGELAAVRGDLERLATGATLPATRQLAFVALIAADEGADRAWGLAAKSSAALRDLLGAMPLIRDPGVRAALYPKVEPLLTRLPEGMTIDPKAANGLAGRYVRVELPGRQRTLTLAEVEVISDGRNVAPEGRARQKNTAHGGEARRAIDGNRSGRYADGGQTHSAEGTPDPWWELDLGSERAIDAVTIYSRTDGNLDQRLSNFTLLVLDADRKPVYRKAGLPPPTPRATYEVGGGGVEGSIRRAAMLALTSVRGQEGPAFKALAKFAREGRDRHAAIQAIGRIPAASWPADEARPLLESLVAFVRDLPPADRTSPAARDALQLGEALAGLLPPDGARKARKELGALGVRLIRVGTITDQMLFDKERLVVQAGRPVEVLFENSDLMPHNFVVTRPGALERIGLQAEATATQPGAAERNYVPASDDVLVASRLLQPRESQALSFTAPPAAGVYPYVCTYPGHWRRMFGSLYVVDDLEEYLADPEGYLAGHPLAIADELLKVNRPRKDWTLADLTPFLEAKDQARSFANGRQIFQVANCVACHKLGGVGVDVGPDLTKLDPKPTTTDLLRHILEPSEKIDDKYATYAFDTESGRVITGLILEETADAVKVIEDPLAKSAPVVLKKSEIAERKKAPTSIMPKGLLDKLTREELLDLIAYIAAGANPESPVYKAGGGHGHRH